MNSRGIIDHVYYNILSLQTQYLQRRIGKQLLIVQTNVTWRKNLRFSGYHAVYLKLWNADETHLDTGTAITALVF